MTLAFGSKGMNTSINNDSLFFPAASTVLASLFQNFTKWKFARSFQMFSDLECRTIGFTSHGNHILRLITSWRHNIDADSSTADSSLAGDTQDSSPDSSPAGDTPDSTPLGFQVTCGVKARHANGSTCGRHSSLHFAKEDVVSRLATTL